MMQTLAAFAALSMVGTIFLSLLPEGGIKRTAGMIIGLFTLLCWAEGISALLGIELTHPQPSTAFTSTKLRIESAASNAKDVLCTMWEAAQ